MRDVLLTIGGGEVFAGHTRYINLDRLTPDGTAIILEQHRKNGIVFFHGGADVMPQLYGERNLQSYTDADRDVRYLWVWQLRKALGIPFFGVCGGHQFITVVNGGSLYQDLATEAFGAHPSVHDVTFDATAPDWLIAAMDARRDRVVSTQRRVYRVNSTHHQATRGVPPNAQVIARAHDSVIEALLYEDGFTCQWHPEFYDHNELYNAIRERF